MGHVTLIKADILRNVSSSSSSVATPQKQIEMDGFRKEESCFPLLVWRTSLAAYRILRGLVCLCSLLRNTAQIKPGLSIYVQSRCYWRPDAFWDIYIWPPLKEKYSWLGLRHSLVQWSTIESLLLLKGKLPSFTTDWMRVHLELVYSQQITNKTKQ